MTAEAPVSAEAPMAPEPRRLVARRQETPDTVTLTLAPLPGASAPIARPGQMMMLSAFGHGEVPISLSGLGRPDGAVEHTIRGVGDATDALLRVPEGGIVGARGPYGQGWDLSAAAGRDVVVIAGGIGLAPLRPVVEELLDRRDEVGSLLVLVGARTPTDLCFAEDLATWRERGADVRTTVDRVQDGGAAWDGPIGVVTSLLREDSLPPGTVGYVCGPEVMMRFAVRALESRNVASEAIQVSAERNMVCGIGHCGHCQLGPFLLCRDGPVLRAPQLMPLLEVRQR